MQMKVLHFCIIGGGIMGLYTAHLLLSNEFRIKFPYSRYKVDLFEYRENFSRNHIVMNGFNIGSIDELHDYDVKSVLSFLKENVRYNTGEIVTNILDNSKPYICKIADLQKFLLSSIQSNEKFSYKKEKIVDLDRLSNYDMVFVADGSNSTMRDLCGIHTITTPLSSAITFTWTNPGRRARRNRSNRYRYFNVNDFHYGAIQILYTEHHHTYTFKDIMEKYSIQVNDFCNYYNIELTELESVRFDIVPIHYSKSSEMMTIINNEIPCMFVGDALINVHFFSGSAIPIAKMILEYVFNHFFYGYGRGAFEPVIERLIDRSIKDINNSYYRSLDFYKHMVSFVTF